jgi:hypothetical protein
MTRSISGSLFKERSTLEDRHCQPTGRANARPTAGSAKQSISPLAEAWIASSLSLLAMTADSRFTF